MCSLKWLLGPTLRLYVVSMYVYSPTTTVHDAIVDRISLNRIMMQCESFDFLVSHLSRTKLVKSVPNVQVSWTGIANPGFFLLRWFKTRWKIKASKHIKTPVLIIFFFTTSRCFSSRVAPGQPGGRTVGPKLLAHQKPCSRALWTGNTTFLVYPLAFLTVNSLLSPYLLVFTCLYTPKFSGQSASQLFKPHVPMYGPDPNPSACGCPSNWMWFQTKWKQQKSLNWPKQLSFLSLTFPYYKTHWILLKKDSIPLWTWWFVFFQATQKNQKHIFQL